MKTFVLFGEKARENAIQAVRQSPDYFRVEIKEPKRTLDQNSKMWAMLKDLSEQVELNGTHYDPADWKTMCMHGLNKEMRFAPSLDGKGFIPLGYSTHKLSVNKMKDLIEFIYFYGSQHQVIWSEPIQT